MTTDLRGFELIIPCGIPDHAVTSLEREVARPEKLPELESIAQMAARQFGLVFDEQVLASIACKRCEIKLKRQSSPGFLSRILP